MAAAAPAQVISIPQWRIQIQELPKVDIKQQIRAIEVLTSYDANNRYDIVDPSGAQIMYAKEKTEIIQRNCCPPLWRHTEAEVSQKVGGVVGSPYMAIDKPYTCTYMCLARPVVHVTDTQNNAAPLGTIDVPFSCCDIPYVAKAPDGHEMFTVSLTTNCCAQPGLYCPMPCGPCKTVDFKATDPKGEQIASWTKELPGWCAACFAPGTDNYHVEFGRNQTPEEKAMMVATALSLDLVNFNNPSNSS